MPQKQQISNRNHCSFLYLYFCDVINQCMYVLTNIKMLGIWWPTILCKLKQPIFDILDINLWAPCCDLLSAPPPLVVSFTLRQQSINHQHYIRLVLLNLRKTYSLVILVIYVTIHMIASFEQGKTKGFPVFGKFCNSTYDWFF